jgi:cobalt/nickel transport system permease protein
MHIPDGFLDARTAISGGVLASVGLGLALRDARLRLPQSRVPLLGLTAAALFVGQLVNFPIAGGTSGHLVGGVLAAALVGPTAAIVVLSAVLILQALVFADGGVLALGANILNMAIVGTLGGHAVAVLGARLLGRRGRLVAVALGAWVATMLAALACAGELALSGAAPARPVLYAMGASHALIGVGEALITVLILAAVTRARPELAAPERPGGLRALGLGLIVLIAVGLFVAPLASGSPDGLEAAAAALGFAGRAGHALGALLPDYRVPGLSAGVSAVVAGAAGALLLVGGGLLVRRLLRRDAT